jgi:hypothetical protein
VIAEQGTGVGVLFQVLKRIVSYHNLSRVNELLDQASSRCWCLHLSHFPPFTVRLPGLTTHLQRQMLHYGTHLAIERTCLNLHHHYMHEKAIIMKRFHLCRKWTELRQSHSQSNCKELPSTGRRQRHGTSRIKLRFSLTRAHLSRESTEWKLTRAHTHAPSTV